MNVLDISRGVAGAYCAQMLALLGAQVVKAGLTTRYQPGNDGMEELEYHTLNRGKTFEELDVQQPTDRERFLALVASAEVLIEDLGTAADNSLFSLFAENVIFARQPRLIMVRISDFGQTGPRAAWSASELTNLASGGLLFLTGTWDREPVQLAPWQAQLTAGLLAAIGTASAWYAGGPVTLDFSKQEAILSMVLPALTAYEYTGVIESREGKVGKMTRIERSLDGWVYAGPSSPTTADYAVFSAFLELPELAEPRFSTAEQRMDHWQEHQQLILPRLRQRTTQAWVNEAEAWRLTFGLVQTTFDLLACPVLQERAFFTMLPISGRPISVPLAPYLVDGIRPVELQGGVSQANLADS